MWLQLRVGARARKFNSGAASLVGLPVCRGPDHAMEGDLSSVRLVSQPGVGIMEPLTPLLQFKKINPIILGTLTCSQHPEGHHDWYQLPLDPKCIACHLPRGYSAQ